MDIYGSEPGCPKQSFQLGQNRAQLLGKIANLVAVLTIWHIQFKAMPIKNGSNRLTYLLEIVF